MFAPGFSANASDWNAFTQWHNSGTTGCTTSFRVNGNTLAFGVCGGDPNKATTPRWVIDQNQQDGIWYDFVVHVKWSSDPNTGFVQVWMAKNGNTPTTVVPLTHTPTLYTGQTVYFKQGYYRNAQPNVAVIYDDATRERVTPFECA